MKVYIALLRCLAVWNARGFEKLINAKYTIECWNWIWVGAVLSGVEEDVWVSGLKDRPTHTGTNINSRPADQRTFELTPTLSLLGQWETIDMEFFRRWMTSMIILIQDFSNPLILYGKGSLLKRWIVSASSPPPPPPPSIYLRSDSSFHRPLPDNQTRLKTTIKSWPNSIVDDIVRSSWLSFQSFRSSLLHMLFLFYVHSNKTIMIQRRPS